MKNLSGCNYFDCHGQRSCYCGWLSCIMSCVWQKSSVMLLLVGCSFSPWFTVHFWQWRKRSCGSCWYIGVRRAGRHSSSSSPARYAVAVTAARHKNERPISAWIRKTIMSVKLKSHNNVVFLFACFFLAVVTLSVWCTLFPVTCDERLTHIKMVFLYFVVCCDCFSSNPCALTECAVLV